MQSKLGQEVGDVRLSGPLADDQRFGDIAIAEPLADKLGHFAFATTEWAGGSHATRRRRFGRSGADFVSQSAQLFQQVTQRHLATTSPGRREYGRAEASLDISH